ncbi:MAG: hypothetical protein MUC92_08095 [Fimbriimonadaceae bacterium]|jgi:hypothetical protein|nr:hypothetical protein [Fimbriimonadaceae bacterium]
MGRIALVFFLAIFLLGAFGCSEATNTEATPSQEKAFEGGPMPEGTQERVQQELEKARVEAEKKAAEQRSKGSQ